MATPSANQWTCPTCGRTLPADYAVCPHDATPRAEMAKTGDALIGEVLGRTYKLVRMIGQGGMARLYEAEHLRIETRYAVKVIHDDLVHEPDLLARFEREARAAARIKSEHVVRLVDVLRTADNRPCLVTELLEGEDLQAALDRGGKLSVAEAIPIARQICRAVAAGHAAGVVHRDLKPSNVFLCKAADGPLVKVFDFGVAKLDDDEKLTRTDAVMGTAAYMAPEQARKAADAGPLADVYSIGAVIYHMLAGEPPYGNVPAVSRFALVLHEEPARPRSIEPSIPAGIEAVIQHAMARDRAARIQSALDLDAQLAAFDRRVTQPRASVPTPAMPLPTVSSSGGMNVSALAAQSPEATAADINLRARLTRPVAAGIAVLSSLAAGAWIAAFLAVIISPASTGERGLIAVIGLAAAAGLAVFHHSRLKPSWQSAPAVAGHVRPFARALVAGALLMGALDLLAYGSSAMFNGEPLNPGLRIVLSGAAGVVGLGWQRWKLDERLRRRIG